MKLRSTSTRVAISMGVLATLAVSCSPGSDHISTVSEGPRAPSVSAAPPASVAGPATLPAVLKFNAPRLGGGTVSGADYAGKDLAIWFWAPW